MERMNVFEDVESQEKKEQNNSSEEINLQQNFKDSVFTDLFKSKDNLLDLYFSLHPYDKNVTIDDIEDIKLDNTFFTNRYNDIAFRAGERLIVLVEHQSTVNFNMPLRMLFYVAEEYKKVIKPFEKRIYGRKLVPLPAPEFYVVYTGKDPQPSILRFSDALGSNLFMEINVNVIKEEDANSVLGGYMQFVREVDEARKTMPDKEAVIYAMDELKGKSRISDYLESKREEIVAMMLYEYNQEKEKEALLEEGREEGRAEGREEGREELIIQSIINLHKNHQSKDYIVQTLMLLYSLDTSSAVNYYEKAMEFNKN